MKWFCDNENEAERECFNTEKEALDKANEWIQSYLDRDGWSEIVDFIHVCKITHSSKECDRQDRPDTIDEEGCDGEGEYWPSNLDYKINYKMKPI